MSRRPRDFQPDLFGGTTTLMPPLIRETRKLYCAVLYTRIYRNKPCWRAGGGKHIVAGRQLTSAELLATLPPLSDLVLFRLGFSPAANAITPESAASRIG